MLVGKKLIEFKLAIHFLDDNAKDFVIKTSRLGVFNFRASFKTRNIFYYLSGFKRYRLKSYKLKEMCHEKMVS